MRLLWLSALTCNGNAHSLLNYPNLRNWQKDFEWLYHPLLPSRYTFKEIEEGIEGCEVLIVEGTFSEELVKYRQPFKALVERYGAQARHIVTVGTCAAFGGIFAQGEEGRSGLFFRGEEPTETFEALRSKSINLPGCPIQPEVLVGTLALLKAGETLPLDRLRRPKYYYAYTVHNGCTRNEYFEYKIDEHRFGSLEGCMFYEHGCQGTFTHGSCNKILWNGLNSKTRNGQPCMGCTEPDFPRMGLWTTQKHMGIPARLPVGVPRRAYLSLAGIAKAFRIERFYKPLMEEE
ncbi:hydrogenase [Nitratifractor salsuginis]|uniref:Ni-Fe hydrogenase, small subunit n=1 Tax=Nitratifractor salsuginis (strain DSM 16511 / JCM 12458 / E9I37-1) TaxID=749222 RepID=E6WY96_NITSE|nr:hydrogenase [Nitratifractor salsuginis]ADV45344.1 Ni-Fe hydrogenase, small subunit [Nitratifractor salsuginis DSM 16511]